jgi:hypothetical protein
MAWDERMRVGQEEARQEKNGQTRRFLVVSTRGT